MQFYNSLNRKKETFVPARPGKVVMYVCGITAYDYCHIGHARSALVFDVLVRHLRYKGLEVTFVRNFTDIDDKIINRANAEGRDWREVADTYIRAFHEDMDRLGVEKADHEPRATENIQEMFAICQKLIAEGKAYATKEGDVYFRVRSYPGYGKLSGRNVDEMRSGARVEPGEEKEDPLDFALWKSAKPDEPFFESPWGKGRPGWHIECSAMSAPYLPLDIHGGGLDLIFPHHENEIAQTEAACGCELSHFWMHNGFVQVDSEKMSKSLGNFRTIRDILENCQPETLRFFLLNKHYRSPIDFTAGSLDEAEKALKRIYECLMESQKALTRAKWKKIILKEDLLGQLESLNSAIEQALDDDLNTASALGHIFNMVRLANRVLEDPTLKAAEGAKDFLEKFLAAIKDKSAIFGLFAQDPEVWLEELRGVKMKKTGIDLAKVNTLLEKRLNLKKEKDFTGSDAVRDELSAMGISVRDTPEGQKWDIS